MAICVYCKKEFVPKRQTIGMYCSRACVYADHAASKQHKEAVCDFCGKVYTPKQWKNDAKHHYCSQKCEHDSLRGYSELVSCPICGKQFMPNCDRKTFCSNKCSSMSRRVYYKDKQEQRKIYNARYREKHRAEYELKARQREEAKEARAKAKEEAKLLKLQARFHPCAICGTMTDRPKYCSQACANRAENNRKEVKRRHKLRENGKVDYSISLESLILRDKNICHICGCKCDRSDYQMIDGVFIAGNMYPSIDHVIAVANGGTHEWSNVKLAHRICNSNKNAEAVHEAENGQLMLWA